MSDERRRTGDIWEKIYSEGHQLSYPNDVFVAITHRLLSPKTHPKVLDYGFGSGENVLYFLNRGFEAAGCEISASALKTASARVAAAGRKADLRLIENERIPFPDASFDAVTSWQVLNYNTWESLAVAVKEIDRVLKPGGLFFGAVDAPGDYKHTHSEPLGDDLYRLTASAQKGAVTIVVDKDRVGRYFPGRKLTIGHFGHTWEDVDVRYWIVSYEK